jgi:hypothetical protein
VSGASFDATERLLLAAASVAGEPARQRRLDEAIAAGIDWDRLPPLAAAHRVGPLVERALAGRPLDAAGRRARDELAEAARRSLYASALLAGELPALLDRLAAAGVEALAYKGPTLALAAYGSLALRPFDDLDLAVRERDFPRAKAALAAAGLEPSSDEFASVRHLSHEQAFEARAGRLQVDLHGRLFSRELFPVPLEPFLARSARVRVGERAVATLRAEDLLVVLCEHAHKHLWVRLVWLADLARLAAATPRLDWDASLALARASGSRRVLGIGLLLAAELLDAPMPPEVCETCRSDARLVALAAEVRERLFAPLTGERAERELSALQWRSRERWSDRMRYLLTPNEADWMLWPLPARWRAVHYLLRPFRLALKYGWAPRRGRRSDRSG